MGHTLPMIRFDLGFGLLVMALAPSRSRYERATADFPEYDRPGRAAATDSGDDEKFLRQVRERAEEQRRAHRESQMAREREEHEKLQRRLRRPEQDGDPESPDTGP